MSVIDKVCMLFFQSLLEGKVGCQSTSFYEDPFWRGGGGPLHYWYTGWVCAGCRVCFTPSVHRDSTPGDSPAVPLRFTHGVVRLGCLPPVEKKYIYIKCSITKLVSSSSWSIIKVIIFPLTLTEWASPIYVLDLYNPKIGYTSFYLPQIRFRVTRDSGSDMSKGKSSKSGSSDHADFSKFWKYCCWHALKDFTLITTSVLNTTK